MEVIVEGCGNVIFGSTQRGLNLLRNQSLHHISMIFPLG